MAGQQIRTIIATRNPLPTVWLLAGLALSTHALGQVPVDEHGKPIGTYQGPVVGAEVEAVGAGDLLTPAELEELVGPVALYPDDLLAIVLPASTYPLEIVQAARFLDELENDPGLKPDEEWDEAVVALLNYPDVVRMMNEEIDWTWRLGEAVLSQQNDLIAAVETFRDRAYAAGNLKTDEYQAVSYDDGVIEIAPIDEEIIYVPYYEPAEVVVRQPRRVYYYYPDPYPVYYYPYPVGYRFRSGYFWGVTTAYGIGWRNHYLRVHHPSYWGHPYYGRYYYGHYYRRPSITVYNNWYVDRSRRTVRHRYRDGDYWRPRRHAGSRQRSQVVNNYHYRDRSVSRNANRTSRNERRYSTERRSSTRRDAQGRMDLNLRDRGSRRTTSTARRDVAARNENRRARVEPSTRSRSANSRVASRQRTLESSPNNRERRAAANRNEATIQRRSTSAASRRDSTRRTAVDVQRAAATARARPSVDSRRSTASRQARPATRQHAANSARSSGVSRRSSAAPAARQPAASRANSRSTGRSASSGESRTSNNRRANSSRRRNND